MTLLEKMREVLTKNEDLSETEKLIIFAYYYGREMAIKNYSDKVSEHLKKQHERAEKCRYFKMAEEVVGKERYIYSPDYAGDYTNTFGNDEIKEC